MSVVRYYTRSDLAQYGVTDDHLFGGAPPVNEVAVLLVKLRDVPLGFVRRLTEDGIKPDFVVTVAVPPDRPDAVRFEQG